MGLKDYKKKVFIFLFLFLISFIFVQISFNKLVKPNSLIFEKDYLFKNLYNSIDEIDYLFLGDSHTECGILASLLTNESFNYGISGESFVESYYRLNYLIMNNYTINNIILEIDSSMEDDFDSFINRIFFTRNYLNINLIKTFNNNIFTGLLNYNFGFIGRGKFFALILFKSLKLDKYGSYMEYKLEKKNIDYKNYNNYEVNESIYLNKIINLTKENNIKLFFIRYPMYSINKTISYESSLNSSNVLNYQLFLNESKYYRDSTHLNYLGAYKLSEQISKDITLFIK